MDTNEGGAQGQGGGAGGAGGSQGAPAQGTAQGQGQAQGGQGGEGAQGAQAASQGQGGSGQGGAGEGGQQQAQVAEWRKAIVEARSNGDSALAEKLTKKLERFNDPAALFSSWEEAERKLSEKTTFKVPGADAPDEERAAFNKTLGVPEKPDGYKIDYKAAAGADYTPDEADMADMAALTKMLHEEGGLAASPHAVQAVAKAYFKMKEQVIAQAEATAVREEASTAKALKDAWGADFNANMSFAKQGARALFGSEWDTVKNWRTPDGQFVGSNKIIVEALARAGRTFAQDPLLAEMAGMEDKPQSLEAEKATIMSWRNGDAAARKKYEEAQRPGGRLEAINAKLAMLSERSAA